MQAIGTLQKQVHKKVNVAIQQWSRKKVVENSLTEMTLTKHTFYEEIRIYPSGPSRLKLRYLNELVNDKLVNCGS